MSISEGTNNDQMKYSCSEEISRPPTFTTAAGPSRPVAIVVWSGGQMRQLEAVIDVAVKATVAVLAVLPQPSRARAEYQPLKALRRGGTSPAYRGASSEMPAGHSHLSPHNVLWLLLFSFIRCDVQSEEFSGVKWF